MPRRSSGPRYYKSKKGYFAVIRGRRIHLAYGDRNDLDVKRRADEKYGSELAPSSFEIDGDHSTVWQIVNAYYLDCEARKLAENTLTLYKKVFVPFSNQLGTLKIRDLRPRHIREFLAKMQEPRPHPKKR